MEKIYIKTDKNGTKYYSQKVSCWRCGNIAGGLYIVGTNNGQLVPSGLDNGVCWKCHGTGYIWETVKEYTPEYQAKLDARRAKRQEKEMAELEARREAEEKEREAKEKEQAEREARIAAEKAKSNYVGEVGEKLEKTVTVAFTSSYEYPSFRGYGMATMYIYGMKDAEGNLMVWKTANGSLNIERKVYNQDGSKWYYENEYAHKGDVIRIKGTVKEHSEYKGQKQTILTRVKTLEILERAGE